MITPRLLGFCLTMAALCLVAHVAIAQPAAPGTEKNSEPLFIARAQYFGGDYYTDPTSLPNLAEFASEQTGANWKALDASVSPLDPSLNLYPVLYLTGHGEIQFRDDEAEALRTYLERGGFLFVNDNGPEKTGNSINQSFRREIKKVLPDNPLVELPNDHPIYAVFHNFPKGLPQIHRHDENRPPTGYGIYVKGRLAVYYAWNSDLGNGWEDAAVHKDPPEKRLEALRMGTNVLTYAIGQ